MAPLGRGAQHLVEDRVAEFEVAEPDGALVYLRASPPGLSPASGLPDLMEARVQAIEAHTRELANAVASTRVILALVERRLSELKEVEARIETLSADLGARERPARRSRVRAACPLSSRELEVLMGLSDGKVYKQIAQDMSLSVSTVRSHLHRTYAKLGVPDRAQAVLLASKHGWI